MKCFSEKWQWKIVVGILLFAIEVSVCHGIEMEGGIDSQKLNFKDDPIVISFPSAARTSTNSNRSNKISSSRLIKLKNPPPPVAKHPHVLLIGNNTQIESKPKSTYNHDESSTKKIATKHSSKQAKLSSSLAFQVINSKSSQATPKVFVNKPNKMSEAIRKTPSKKAKSSKKPLPTGIQDKTAKKGFISTLVKDLSHGFSKMFASRSISDSARTLLLAAPLVFAEAMTLGGVGLAAPALFLAPLLLIPLILVTFIIFI